MLVMPSDHMITDLPAFHEATARALPLIAEGPTDSEHDVEFKSFWQFRVLPTNRAEEDRATPLPLPCGEHLFHR